MARFFGEIGYGTSVENPTGSGVWKDQITELPYYGDVIRKSSKLEPGQGLNDNVAVGNSISVVADQYAVENFSKIRYIRWEGTLWIVSTVEVQRPRLILTLGDIYNGPVSSEPPP